MEHSHVAVFHGPGERYEPGLVVHRVSTGWEVVDETGRVGPPRTSYGTFPSQSAACREALRLLRARFGESTFPCWNSGADAALSDLGYQRGRLGWRWWPPKFVRVGGTSVGVDGRPVRHVKG
jgi:hypothetical protein